MTIIKRYLDLKQDFEKLDADAKVRAYALKDLAARLEAPVNQQPSRQRLDVGDDRGVDELLAARQQAWGDLHDAWEALPPERQEQLPAPAARRPTRA